MNKYEQIWTNMNKYSNHFYVSIESLIFLKEIQKGFPQYVNCTVTVVTTAYTGWLERKDNFFFGCDSVGHCKNKICIITGLFLNGCWDTAVGISRSIAVRFLFVVLDEEWSVQKERWSHQTNFSLAFWMLLPA